MNQPKFIDIKLWKFEKPASACWSKIIVPTTNKIAISADGMKTGREKSKYLFLNCRIRFH